jgi:hypothetical protein
MPVDTVKTTMQVTGKFSSVVDKIKVGGPLTLYNGAIAAASATFVGHYPWFFTYNYLSENIPKQDTQLMELGRRAILGFCSSAVSDTCSNSIRVIKVYKQSHKDVLTYGQVVRNVIAESGVSGLMWRPRFWPMGCRGFCSASCGSTLKKPCLARSRLENTLHFYCIMLL